MLERNDHLKTGDRDRKELSGLQIFHLVGAVHATHLSAQITAAHILVTLSGLKNRLHTYHPFSLYFAVSSVAVENKPMATMQFYRK